MIDKEMIGSWSNQSDTSWNHGEPRIYGNLLKSPLSFLLVTVPPIIYQKAGCQRMLWNSSDVELTAPQETSRYTTLLMGKHQTYHSQKKGKMKRISTLMDELIPATWGSRFDAMHLQGMPCLQIKQEMENHNQHGYAINNKQVIRCLQMVARIR